MYHSEIFSKDYHNKNFENDLLIQIDNIVKFLKKEYKKIIGKTLFLKKIKEPQMEISNTSRIRSWVVVKCFYEIENIKKV